MSKQGKKNIMGGRKIKYAPVFSARHHVISLSVAMNRERYRRHISQGAE